MHFCTPLVLLLLSLIYVFNLFSKPSPPFSFVSYILHCFYFFLLFYHCPTLHIHAVWFLFLLIYFGFISPSFLFRIQNFHCLYFFSFILYNFSNPFISLPSLRASESFFATIFILFPHPVPSTLLYYFPSVTNIDISLKRQMSCSAVSNTLRHWEVQHRKLLICRVESDLLI